MLLEPAKKFQLNERYVVEIPDINVTIHVKCCNLAFNACDLQIYYMEKNNEPSNIYDNFWLSYRYEWNMQSIHFSTFDHLERCVIYKIIYE
jgi:hypothetical protein